MREIKFRGKNAKGEWVYGDLLRNRGETFIAPEGIANPLATIEDFRVDPETVGQLTGLKDKNGKGIYEGDILCSDNGYSEPIGWSEDNAAFSTMDFSDGEYIYEIDMVLASTKKVIGSIHDNPELLETPDE